MLRRGTEYSIELGSNWKKDGTMKVTVYCEDHLDNGKERWIKSKLIVYVANAVKKHPSPPPFSLATATDRFPRNNSFLLGFLPLLNKYLHAIPKIIAVIFLVIATTSSTVRNFIAVGAFSAQGRIRSRSPGCSRVTACERWTTSNRRVSNFRARGVATALL